MTKPQTSIDSLTPLPNGSDQAYYEDALSWGYRRFAWEFLRRNPEFREGCCEVDLIQEKKLALSKKTKLAEKFMLRRYRHCDEPWAESDRIGTFIVRGSHLVSGSLSGQWSRPLREFEVGFRVNIRPGLFSNDIVKLATAQFERKLSRQIQLLQQRENIEAFPSPRSDNYKLALQLQVLDLVERGAPGCKLTVEKKLTQIASNGTIKRYTYSPNDDPIAGLDNALNSALRLVNFGYIALAASPTVRRTIPRN